MKKENFWCRLEQNRVTGGPAACVFAKNAENGPKTQKWPFLEIFRKFQKYAFSTIICDQNAKFWGPGTKNDHFRAKNVIFRISGNIDYLKSKFLQNFFFQNLSPPWFFAIAP